MRIILLITSLIFYFNPAAAQDYKLLFTVTSSAGEFTTDPLGNFYVFNKGDITKYSAEGYETARFSSREFGDISYVDATNPLKVLVVFKEFSRALILDASLSTQVSINLSFPGIPYVNNICTSRESGYWIVDPVSKQLHKINEQLDIVSEGTPFRQISSSDSEAYFICDSGNWIIVNTKTTGVLVFDRFGTYYKSLPDIPPVPLQASGHEILYKDDDGMIKVDIRTGKSDHFLLPPNEPEDACRVEGNHIFLKTDNLLKIYSY